MAIFDSFKRQPRAAPPPLRPGPGEHLAGFHGLGMH